MDGVKPTGIENGVMKFELKNGVFKQMCIEAFKKQRRQRRT
jgi:GTPase subunit of restriction endonuclease